LYIKTFNFYKQHRTVAFSSPAVTATTGISEQGCQGCFWGAKVTILGE